MPETETTAGIATTGPKLEEIKQTWPATVDISLGSAAFSLSRSYGYELAARGAFPCRTIKVGGRTRVLTSSLIRVLEGGEP